MLVFTATLLSTDVATGRNVSRRRTVFRMLLATVLLTAEGLKAHQIATVPSLGGGLLNARRLHILVVEFELFFGIWLLFGMLPKFTWFAAQGIGLVRVERVILRYAEKYNRFT